jgi:hypothetical protein
MSQNFRGVDEILPEHLDELNTSWLQAEMDFWMLP